MKLAVITPTNYWSLVDRHDDGIILSLAHWLMKDEEYKERVAEYKGYKILDNSAAEGQLVKDINILLELADDIGADEVVIPDVFRDSKASAAFVEYNYDIIKNDGYKPFIVLQGSSFKEFENYWRWLHERGYTEATIGIPNEVFMVLGGIQPRNKFMYWMMGRYPWVMDYEIHYLGYSTLYDWTRAPRIVRSTDSGIFIKAALKNMDELPFRHIKGFHLEPDIEFDLDVYNGADRMIVLIKEMMMRGV